MKGESRSTFGKERVSLSDRFWSKVQKGSESECWPWQGAKTITGYGYLFNRRKPNVLAHRLSYEMHYGAIPVHLCVCHRCDNPPCVNPAHLFVGTRADNHADMLKKGRQVVSPGERNGRAKLDPEKVTLGKQMRQDGATQQAIADHLGVSQVAVSKFLRGDTWKDS